MRNQALKNATAMLMGLGVLAGAKVAFAGNHGVVFIHGTGDYPGSVTNSGTNAYVSSAYGGSNYWESGEVASIAGSRPFIVVGYSGASCAPWPQSGDTTYGKTSTGSACPLASSTGNSDVITSQIATWMTAQDITDIVLVTHSGGSNQARYIMNNYTRNTNYTKVKNATKRVITVAGTTKGTYLANEVFSGGALGSALGDLAGFVGFGGEGVNLLRTNYISTYNSSSSYLGPVQNPVNGVNFYSTGGKATTIKCVGFTLFGACIGISNVRSLDGGSTPLSACDSVLMDTGLLFLHDTFLDANDSSTARSTTSSNGGSDGFISILSSQALGNTFSYNAGQDHNESRRQCNGLDQSIRSYVNSSESGFSLPNQATSANVSPIQIDACGFSKWATVYNSNNQAAGYTEGCQLSQLGNGNCDWDCVALFGNDAAVTSWACATNAQCGSGGVCSGGVCTSGSSNTPASWGTSDCTATAGTTSGVATSTSPWAEVGTYVNGSTTYDTLFNGATCTGTSGQCGGNSTSTEWFLDPNYDSMAPSTWNGTPCTTSSQCPGELSCSSGFCTACTNSTYGAAGSCNGQGSVENWTGGVCSPLKSCTQNSQCASGTCSNHTCSPNPQDGNGVCYYATPNQPTFAGSPSTSSLGYCPQSWIGDGTCDECVLALYGSDGNDCLPGRMVQCAGFVTAAQPYSGSTYSYYDNGVFNGGSPASGGRTALLWNSFSPASSGDGICENTECGSGTAAAVPTVAVDGTGLVPCTSGSQCPGYLGCGDQVAGYCDKCTTSNYDYSGSCNGQGSLQNWTGNTCNASTGVCFQTATLTSACNSNSDCLSGSCVNNGCTTASSDCTASYAAPASTYACTANSDCTNYGGTCSGGFCSGTITTNLCR